MELLSISEADGWDNTFLWKGRLSHQALGGVTNGSWMYRCSEPLGIPKKGVNRNLGLVLNPTHGDRPMSRVTSELLAERKPLVESNLIDPCDTTSWVVAPSVFTSGDEKVIRRLQIDELLDVYEVEVVTQKELDKYWRCGHCLPSCAFAPAAPLKIGIEATRLFYQKLRYDDSSIDLPSENDFARPRKRSANDTSLEITTSGKKLTTTSVEDPQSFKNLGCLVTQR